MTKRNDETPEGTMPETAPDPWVVLQSLATSLEKLASRQVEAPSTNNAEMMATLSAALVRISETNLEGSKLIAQETKRAARPSNEVVHNRSVFNRRGELLPDDAIGPRKPKLKCPMMIPWLIEWESITREEAELLNLLEPGEFVVKRIDGSKVKVNCIIEYGVKGNPTRLLMNHDTAFNQDNFRLVPPMPDMLRQILRQCGQPIPKQAVLIMTDEEEEALIEAKELTVSQ